MSDAGTAKLVATRIAAYLAAVPPDAPNPDDLAWIIVHELNQAGLLASSGPRPDAHEKSPGAQQVLALPDRNDGARVIVCAGEFDQRTLQAVQEAGTAAITDPNIRRIILDVSRVTFADSSMLNEMFRLRRNSRLVLIGPLPTSLERVLELTQARALFHVADSIEAALAWGE
ncbi:STAS domain-containing protein [Streptomyces sp. NBC_00335]|uniref:STAS domain-containing protein n=1 Tax=unclassified Streptomyces TaxID=2593676 RepID=UPI002259B3D7|nr:MULTISPECIES: STAS domain-containing protein [unclassified Streptomyces]MCX5403051.1 STAS domain-containing protein [Streptomyces sp. NBC_00086]